MPYSYESEAWLKFWLTYVPYAKTKINWPLLTEVEKVWFSWQEIVCRNITFTPQQLEDVNEVKEFLAEVSVNGTEQ